MNSHINPQKQGHSFIFQWAPFLCKNHSNSLLHPPYFNKQHVNCCGPGRTFNNRNQIQISKPNAKPESYSRELWLDSNYLVKWGWLRQCETCFITDRLYVSVKTGQTELGMWAINLTQLVLTAQCSLNALLNWRQQDVVAIWTVMRSLTVVLRTEVHLNSDVTLLFRKISYIDHDY